MERFVLLYTERIKNEKNLKDVHFSEKTLKCFLVKTSGCTKKLCLTTVILLSGGYVVYTYIHLMST